MPLRTKCELLGGCSPDGAAPSSGATSNCNQCHVALSVHGGLRNQTKYCVLCHNPSNTDIARRPAAVVAADKALPPQGINFNLLVHRIHSGENLLATIRPYVVVGFGGSHNDFSEVRYPAMSPQGAPGDRRNCAMCHIGGSEQISRRERIQLRIHRGRSIRSSRSLRPAPAAMCKFLRRRMR